MHHPLVVRAGKHDICTYKVGQILLAWGVPQDPLSRPLERAAWPCHEGNGIPTTQDASALCKCALSA